MQQSGLLRLLDRAVSVLTWILEQCRQRYNRDSPRLRSSKFVRIYAESVLRHVVVIKNVNQSLLTGATGCEGTCSKINVALIIKHMKGGEFVKANDAYILTAIGNAAWPIGVTSVGIHQRTAHDKMQTGKVAHVMNNESQRKYLQSVKRLMRFEQNRRKDVAPSKKVQ